MSSTFDKLNLRPMERRLVIGVGIVVFIVLNVWFVRPHFGDWRKAKAEHQRTLDTLAKYKEEIGRKRQYEIERAKFEEAGQSSLGSAEMAVQLRRTIQSKASESGLVPNVNELPRGMSSPDQFFEEQAVKLSFTTGEKELIDFLFNISEGKSMIRVKDLNIRPDPQMQRLQGEATLSASYQKKAAPAAGKKGATTAPATRSTPPATAKPRKPDSASVEKPRSAAVEK